MIPIGNMATGVTACEALRAELCDFVVDPPAAASADVRGRHVAENVMSAEPVQVVADGRCATPPCQPK